MNEADRDAVDDLFDRLRQVEERSAPRDPEAEALIHASVSAQPAAPYYMAQTIIVQNAALAAAQRRIADLESEARQADGGLLSGLFGDRRQHQGRETAAERQTVPREGSFLGGAAQTALGVTGGVLLGNLIAGSLFGRAAEAAEPLPETAGDPGDDAAVDTDGDFDVGDFDIGF